MQCKAPARLLTPLAPFLHILQEYTMAKRAEHAWKAVVQDGGAVSVTDPRAYRERFLRAMQQLFVAGPASMQ